MKPDEQAQSAQPTSMTGSDWQRQALAAARAGAAAAKHSDAASPAMEAARQRAAAQQVPDMLAAAETESVPAAQSAPQASAVPAQPSQSVPSPSVTATGEATGRPVVSGALAPDTPTAGAPVVGTGGTSTGKKVGVTLLIVIILLGAAAAGYFLFMKDTNSAVPNQQEQNSSAETETDSETELRDRRNNQRQTDATAALAAVSQYAANNNGEMPTKYTDGTLTGDSSPDTPTALTLHYYQSLQFATDAQASFNTDELLLVTGALCDGDTGSTVAGSSRAVAALYGEEQADGSFVSTCKEE